MIDIATIIVDYKTLETTYSYIIHLCDMIEESEDMMFIIVDNSEEIITINNKLFIDMGVLPLYKTTYGEIDFAKKIKYINHNILYLHMKYNGGYARGNNIAVDYLYNILHEKIFYILISNNDIVLREKLSLKKIYEVFESNKRIAVVGPKILEKSGIQTSPRKKMSINKVLCLYALNLLLGNRIRKIIDDVEYTQISKDVYWVMGCFLFIKSQPFREVGMFDTETFLYSEEMILSERLRQNSYSMYYLSEISVFHNHAQTIGRHVMKDANIKYLYKSHRLYSKKYRNANWIQLSAADFIYGLCKIKAIFRKIMKNKE